MLCFTAEAVSQGLLQNKFNMSGTFMHLINVVKDTRDPDKKHAATGYPILL